MVFARTYRGRSLVIVVVRPLYSQFDSRNRNTLRHVIERRSRRRRRRSETSSPDGVHRRAGCARFRRNGARSERSGGRAGAGSEEDGGASCRFWRRRSRRGRGTFRTCPRLVTRPRLLSSEPYLRVTRGADGCSRCPHVQAFPSTARSNALQSPGPASSSVDRSNPNSSATSPAASTAAPTALPFSLDLTEQQRLARSRVLNPYAGIDKPIYGEEGYQVPVVPGLGVAGGTGTGSGGGGGIEYVADRGDDLDEEDPDEDLEL